MNSADNVNKRIQLLDCTLRDGAYIVNAEFGTPAIKGIIKKMQDANVEIVECGWLKDAEHKVGTTFYHQPSDILPYLPEKSKRCTYVAMIDWDRYNLDRLPLYDGNSIDAIRVVFPKDKFREGMYLGKQIEKKGYKVYFQAANTLGYTDEQLVDLAKEVNKYHPVCLSVVDTFGAMYGEDLIRIITILDEQIDTDIKLGFHSHNNQQLSFALTMQFIEFFRNKRRDIVIDVSLCGMGRGAGNATTELVAGYLNRKCQGNYDMNAVMDAIDMYMGYFTEHYSWGYSTPYFIAGMYCAHVNNIAYLLKNHRANAKAIRNIIESLSEDERKNYDYDLLESKYLNYQNQIVDDEEVLNQLHKIFADRKILLILPGKSILEKKSEIDRYIAEYNPVVIGVNSIIRGYEYDYLFFSNRVRYDYAKEIYPELFKENLKILASNIKTKPLEDEMVVNFNLLIKRGWDHFDNACIMCLRLLNKLHVAKVALAGFDGFKESYSESYADVSMPPINPGKSWEELNEEIRDMFLDFKKMTAGHMQIEFITDSKINY